VVVLLLAAPDMAGVEEMEVNLVRLGEVSTGASNSRLYSAAVATAVLAEQAEV
jgi:hypothetical protein